MKVPYFLLLALVLFPVFAKASCSPDGNSSFFFESLNGAKTIYDYRVSMFSDFFGKTIFDGDALFVFYEKDGLQSLFIFDADEKSVKVYRLPRIPLLPWINPERYIKERTAALTRGDLIESCHQHMTLDSNVLAELKALEMEKHSYITSQCLGDENQKKQKFNNIILGFLQQQSVRKYFYFEKVGNFVKEMPKEFDAYTKSFDIIENIDKKIVLTRCR